MAPHPDGYGGGMFILSEVGEPLRASDSQLLRLQPWLGRLNYGRARHRDPIHFVAKPIHTKLMASVNRATRRTRGMTVSISGPSIISRNRSTKSSCRSMLI